jgi:selenocysteine lyase/cysteine desulfurase
MGVIAQNIEEVLPELVSGEESKTVNYNGIIGLLIECVKTQQEQIDELNRRLDELSK